MGSFELKPTISEKCTCHSIVPVTTWGEGKRSENIIKTRDLIPLQTETTKWPFDPGDDIVFMYDITGFNGIILF